MGNSSKTITKNVREDNKELKKWKELANRNINEIVFGAYDTVRAVAISADDSAERGYSVG